MRELLNTLYVQTQGSVLHLDNDTVKIKVDSETKLRMPLMRLSGIVVFGRVSLTPFLIQRCAEDGRNLVWLNEYGRFKARVTGPTHGNVLLRRSQHLALSDGSSALQIARQCVAGKLQNSRNVLLRGARDAQDEHIRQALSEVAEHFAGAIGETKGCDDLNWLRGIEGEAARAYFGVFGLLLRNVSEEFEMHGRSRRPPRDRVNTLLSFLYALIRAECSAALESVGLDPQVGFLHALRPGRPALALDLMEEFRPFVADRLTLTLINRKQVQEKHFDELPGGAFHLNEEGRKVVLQAYQKRKEDEVPHPLLEQKVPVGLIPYVQARLLARYLRGDLVEYLPFVYR